ncbi:MAG: hypothetical protein ACE5FS_06880 [Paracoccaceae bacterium]
MRVAAILLVFLLSACFEAETVMHVNPDRTITASSTVEIARRLYDFDRKSKAHSDDYCVGGDLEITDDFVRCHLWSKLPLRNFRLAAANGLPAITARAIGDEIIRVEIPVRALMQAMFKAKSLKPEEERSLKLAKPFIGRAMQDRKLVYAIEGYRVVKTNGRLSEDRTRAEVAVPMADVVDGTAEAPRIFFAEVRFEKCRVAFFCR